MSSLSRIFLGIGSVVFGLIALVCFVGTVSIILEESTIQAIDALVGGTVLGTASAAASVVSFQGVRNKD